MEDLPLGRITALVPEFAVKDLPLGRTLMMMIHTNGHRIQTLQNTKYKMVEIKNSNIQECNMYRARWLRGNARDLHPGGPGFKFRGRPTWLRFLVVSSILK